MIHWCTFSQLFHDFWIDGYVKCQIMCLRFNLFSGKFCGAPGAPKDGVKQHPPFFSFVFYGTVFRRRTLFGEPKKYRYLYSTLYLLFLTPGADAEPAKGESLRHHCNRTKHFTFPGPPVACPCSHFKSYIIRYSGKLYPRSCTNWRAWRV